MPPTFPRRLHHRRPRVPNRFEPHVMRPIPPVPQHPDMLVHRLLEIPKRGRFLIRVRGQATPPRRSRTPPAAPPQTDPRPGARETSAPPAARPESPPPATPAASKPFSSSLPPRSRPRPHRRTAALDPALPTPRQRPHDLLQLPERLKLRPLHRMRDLAQGFPLLAQPSGRVEQLLSQLHRYFSRRFSRPHNTRRAQASGSA